MRSTRIALSALVCCVLVSGCGVPESIEDAAQAIEDAIAKLDGSDFNQNIEEMTSTLDSANANIVDGNIREEINLSIGRAQHAGEVAARSSIDFARTRLREDLGDLRAYVLGGPRPPRIPYISSANPLMLHYSSTDGTTLELAGWNLTPESLAHLSIHVRSGDQVRVLPAAAISRPSPYQIVIRFAPELQSALLATDTGIAGFWRTTELFTMHVVQPLPDRETTVTHTPTPRTSAPVALVPNLNQRVGDGDLNSDNRRPPQNPRGHQEGHVQLRLESNVVSYRISVIFNEGLHDFTRFASDTGWLPLYELSSASDLAKEARATLNLGDAYAGAHVQLVSIGEDLDGYVKLDEFDFSVARHGPLGPVESWEFDGDRDGDDDRANLRVTFKPIVMLVRFHLPDGPPAAKGAPSAAMETGIVLR